MAQLGIIFDFDGVIVISERVHQRAWEDLAAEVGRELPHEFLERGVGYSDAIMSAELAAFWGDPELKAEWILPAKRERYRRRAMAGECDYVPGAVEAIERLAARYPLAVATNSCLSDIEPHLHERGLDRHFQAVLTIDSVARPKPDPEIYLAAASRLGLPPERCWIFEDSLQGVKAARASGARVVGVTTMFSAAQLAPVHHEIKDYRDLEGLERVLREGAA